MCWNGTVNFCRGEGHWDRMSSAFLSWNTGQKEQDIVLLAQLDTSIARISKLDDLYAFNSRHGNWCGVGGMWVFPSEVSPTPLPLLLGWLHVHLSIQTRIQGKCVINFCYFCNIIPGGLRIFWRIKMKKLLLRNWWILWTKGSVKQGKVWK